MYSVRRKQQMLKIRLMGTKSDIRWFQNFLQIDSDIEVLELSDIYPNKGTDRYYRSYAEVERKDGNAGRPTENGKSNRKNNTEKANKGTSSTRSKQSILSWIGRIFRLIQQPRKNPKNLQEKKDINIRCVSYIIQKQ